MVEEKLKDTKNRWEEHANSSDDWYKTFVGAVENFVDWKILKVYLPKDKDKKILDADGGTGRIFISLD